MLTDVLNKIKSYIEPRKDDILTAVIIILVAIIGFGLGRLSSIYERKAPISIEYTNDQAATVQTTANGAGGLKTASAASGAYLASKNGTKYYPMGCAAASRIKEENKVWFADANEAELAGYEPSASCQ